MGLVDNDREKRLRRLQLRERQYRRLLDMLPYAVLVDRGGEILYANYAAARLFGVLAPRDLLERPYAELIMTAVPLRRAGVQHQTLRRADGRLVEVEAVTTLVVRGGKRYRQTVLRELADEAVGTGVTERLRPREAGRTATVVLDAIGDVTQWSQPAETMLGFSAAEMVGKPGSFLIPEDENEHYDFEQILRETVARGAYQLEGWKRRQDGSRFYASQQFTLLVDRSGGVAGFTVLIRDLTDQPATAPERQQEEQLRQAQRMEAVGRLASGIAHDFNNLLTAIQGHAQFLTEDLEPDHPSRADVDEILHSSERAAALTRQLLAFSRGQSLQPETIQLNSVVTSMERLLRRVISEDITLESNLEPQLWSVRADPTQIEQILVNLIVNARDAMPRGGRITIKTANAELTPSYAETHEEVEPGEYVMLAVSDTGIGMDKETQAHIFEPFFSTKGPEKGTGLGLSTVFGIVKQMSGHIYVYSEPGQGTTFKVYIPRAGGSRRVQRRAPQNGTGEGVLIVEDDDSVRALARRVLDARGYRVWISSTPKEALDVLNGHGYEISVLLTDMVLPNMRGQELATQALNLCPHLEVVFMSGYSAEEVRRHTPLSNNAHFLEKPFTPEALARKVREVLNGSSRVSPQQSQP